MEARKARLGGLARAAMLAAILVMTLEPASCLGDDKLRELLRSNGFVEVKVVEAHVPDLDPLPAQGNSDVFVRVLMNDTNELLCETKTVQDDNSPKFDKECTSPKIVPSDTVIRFELFDSDKPADPDTIGRALVRISDLILNRKLDSKESFPIERLDYPKYYIKARIDFKRQP